MNIETAIKSFVTSPIAAEFVRAWVDGALPIVKAVQSGVDAEELEALSEEFDEVLAELEDG